MKIGNYSKAIVAVLSAALVSLQTYYPGAQWVQVVSAGVGAFLVWLVPNTEQSSSTKVVSKPESSPQ